MGDVPFWVYKEESLVWVLRYLAGCHLYFKDNNLKQTTLVGINRFLTFCNDGYFNKDSNQWHSSIAIITSIGTVDKPYCVSNNSPLLP